MLKVFIGYDRREVMPFHVLAQSIFDRASQPVSITPVRLSHLPLTRPPEGSTEFSISRFLVPWLCNYTGTALFMDCDMLVQCDVAKLFDLKDETAVQVVQHDYTPISTTKFYGNKQKNYPKKNWSSVMLFDCSQCTNLTLEYVDSASAMELHQFMWAPSIGALPPEYNHLVGEYPKKQAKIIHWTCGGPWLHRYRSTDFWEDWLVAARDMQYFLDD